jgi:hypothetical protein
MLISGIEQNAVVRNFKTPSLFLDATFAEEHDSFALFQGIDGDSPFLKCLSYE